MFWILYVKENIWEENHFDILSLINWDTKTLILLLTKIYKFQYLSFFSFDFKSEDRPGKNFLNGIYGEKPILIFLVLHLSKSRWLFVFPNG